MDIKIKLNNLKYRYDVYQMFNIYFPLDEIKFEDDGEYLKAKSNKVLFTVLGSVAVVAAISLFILNAKLAKKKAKKEEDSQKTISESTTTFDQNTTTKTEYKCKYCGCIIKDGEITCSKCGAPRK